MSPVTHAITRQKIWLLESRLLIWEDKPSYQFWPLSSTRNLWKEQPVYYSISQEFIQHATSFFMLQQSVISLFWRCCVTPYVSHFKRDCDLQVLSTNIHIPISQGTLFFILFSFFWLLSFLRSSQEHFISGGKSGWAQNASLSNWEFVVFDVNLTYEQKLWPPGWWEPMPFMKYGWSLSR